MRRQGVKVRIFLVFTLAGMALGCANTFHAVTESSKDVGEGIAADTSSNWATVQDWSYRATTGVKKAARNVADGTGALIHNTAKGTKKGWKKLQEWDKEFQENYW